MKKILTFLGLVLTVTLSAQFPQLSEDAELSIITVGPGPNLNDCFGHSAFRIKDPKLNMDRAYNYGTFDLTQKGFYLRFTLGVAEYKLSAYPFEYFYDSYTRQNRWLQEQKLNLTRDELQVLFEKLEINHLPQNQFYRYDPFFDNCATRMRDLVGETLEGKITFNNDHLNEDLTLRDLVDINAFNHGWGDLGIDIALGNRLDKVATPDEYMYLPDYVYSAFENATVNRNGLEEPMVKSTERIFDSNYYEIHREGLRPVLVFTLLAAVVIIFTIQDYIKKKRSRFLDFSIMLATGLVGLLIVFLWFFTSHSTAPNNLNILWAFLPNLVIGFYLLKKQPPKWTRSYVRFLFILLIGLVLIWIAQIQNYNVSLIPIGIMLGVRYVFLWNRGLTYKPTA